MRGPKKDGVAGRRSDNGQARTEPGRAWPFSREQYKQQIEYAGDWKTGRIENRKQQDTRGTPGDQGVSEMMKQFFNLTRDPELSAPRNGTEVANSSAKK